jgi:hypothetical protein
MVTSHQQTEQRRAFGEWAKAQDDVFAKAHPELADRRVAWETMQDVREYMLEKRGMSVDRCLELWNTDPTFRSAEAQSILYDAARQYREEKDRVSCIA